jgi:ribonuclease P/MRP protein subunit RPP1
MKKTYADLHLCPNLKDSEQVSGMINKASMLGYGLVAITFLQNTAEEEIQQVRNLCDEARIDLVTRLDIKPKTPNELVHYLRRFRRKFEIIALICESKNVARQGARDRRVDLLNFPMLDFRKRFFDQAEAELASNGLASLEIDMKPLLILEGPVRIRLLSSLRREAAIAQKFHVPIVVSSGASSVSLMRKPKELAALAFLFDLAEASATKTVSENPSLIIKRNREKLSPRFVAPGIRMIRRGNDC